MDGAPKRSAGGAEVAKDAEPEHVPFTPWQTNRTIGKTMGKWWFNGINYDDPL